MRISDIIGEVIQGVRATRIMGRPVSACVPIKIIIFLQSRGALGTNKIRAHGQTTWVASGVEDKLVGNIAKTLVCNILDDLTL